MSENLSVLAKIFFEVIPPLQQPMSNSRLKFTKWKTDNIPLNQSSHRDLRRQLGLEAGNSPSSSSKKQAK